MEGNISKDGIASHAKDIDNRILMRRWVAKIKMPFRSLGMSLEREGYDCGQRPCIQIP